MAYFAHSTIPLLIAYGLVRRWVPRAFATTGAASGHNQLADQLAHISCAKYDVL